MVGMRRAWVIDLVEDASSFPKSQSRSGAARKKEKDNRKKKKRGEDGGREREREWSD